MVETEKNGETIKAEIEEENQEVETQSHHDIESFLTEYKLQEHLETFKSQQIDYESLMLLTETDLKSLNLPLGPFRKLIVAIKKEKGDVKPDIEGTEKSEEKPEIEEGDKNDSVKFTGDPNQFTVIDESGDESDHCSVKSEGSNKSKQQEEEIIIDKFHPYYYDLVEFKPTEEQLAKCEVVDPTNMDDFGFEIVEDDKSLTRVIRKLRKQSVISVDFKLCNTAYQPMINLLQISTQTADYLFDGTKLKEALLLKLTDVFVNPNIVKVVFETTSIVKHLQIRASLFMVNVINLKMGIRLLNKELLTFGPLIKKYTTYTKPLMAECSTRPLSNSVITNLRKETRFVLHHYFKIKNDLIDGGHMEKLAQISKRVLCSVYRESRLPKPHVVFKDFKYFNTAQAYAAEKLLQWRDELAQHQNQPPNTILSYNALKNFCLCLPVKRDDVFHLVNTKVVKDHIAEIMHFMKEARTKYVKDPAKYDILNPRDPKPEREKDANKRKGTSDVFIPPKKKFKAPKKKFNSPRDSDKPFSKGFNPNNRPFQSGQRFGGPSQNFGSNPNRVWSNNVGYGGYKYY